VTSIAKKAFAGCKSLTRVDIPISVSTIEEGAFLGCSKIPCLYSWDPTMVRAVSPSAGLSSLLDSPCPCDDGFHPENYVCVPNQPSQYPTAAPTIAKDWTVEIVSSAVPISIFTLAYFIYVLLRIRKRKAYKKLKKVYPVDKDDIIFFKKSDAGDEVASDKFNSSGKYFQLGSLEDYTVSLMKNHYHYFIITIIITIITTIIIITIIITIIMFTSKDGLTKKIGVLYRSMEEECTTNDNGKIMVIITITIIITIIIR